MFFVMELCEESLFNLLHGRQGTLSLRQQITVAVSRS